MKTDLPARLIVDARYTLLASGDVLLVALDEDDRWRLWDVAGGNFLGDAYGTAGECYFTTLTIVERANGL